MILMTVVGGVMATARKQRTLPTPNRDKLKAQDVPVQRLAEFVPASFTSVGDNENNPLNMGDARWYKTGDDSITLVLGDDQQQFALEFKTSAMCALATRAEDMAECNIDDLLGLS